MSAEFDPVPDEMQPEVVAEYATWGSVIAPVSEGGGPSLVLGTEERELHLVLDAALLDSLLLDLATYVADEHDQAGEDLSEVGEQRPLGKRLGSSAMSASGWPVTSRWWRSAQSNTRIIVVGVIAAVMVLGLLVTF
ncbi:hypothetical protein [Streptomyces goshikiensis]|uniref:hypothetical protein n=1 Tax=Streptomyces goshikiensis TaxID=1942 RepID=UPI00367FF2DF